MSYTKFKPTNSNIISIQNQQNMSKRQIYAQNIAQVKVQEEIQPRNINQIHQNQLAQIKKQEQPLQTITYKVKQYIIYQFTRAQYKQSCCGQSVSIYSRIIQQDQSLQSDQYVAKTTKARVIKPKNNETKNIAKNYGKAIVAFMLNNKKLIKSICKQTSTPYARLVQQIGYIKQNLLSIYGIRNIWQQYKYSECMRIISQVFLRKYSLQYIFRSKIINVKTHIKYRKQFIIGLQNPKQFDHIKQF